MGQRKGTPTPTVQQQAYMDKYGESAARTNSGTTPVMLDDNTTLNDYVDLTFDTDAVAAMVSGSTNATILAVSGSTNTRIESVISTGTQLASIMAYTASLVSVKLHSGSLVNFVNDAAAATGGVPVGNLYHTTGTVKVRLT
jgi:hypothetical protein